METTTTKIRVWDAPTRVFHWLLVFSFAGAYLTSESERWSLVHITLGYTLGGLIAFRLIWGFVGTRYARFTSFVKGPSEVLQYAKSMATLKPKHFVGHNPLGAAAIVLLLVSGIAIVVTGYAAFNEIGGEWVAGLHEVSANAMLVLVGIHIAGVVAASWLHKENLARAMVNGFKQGKAVDGISRLWVSVAVLLVAAVLGFWYLQWASLG
ncbi:MAG: cytochrome b/b6 domain-containing protein [Comamonadaceae bacterium]